MKELFEPQDQRISGRRISIVALAILVLVPIADWSGIPPLRTVLSLVLLFVIPGLMLVLLFQAKCSSLGEYLVLSVGLSIALLMALGLALNQLLPLFDISHPLAAQFVFPTVFMVNFLLIALVWIGRKRDLVRQVEYASALPDWYLYVLPATFPILSTYGAIRLNNNEGNLFTIVSVLWICLYVFSLFCQHHPISRDALTYSIVLIGLAMLLSFSLRSWHISGWDINQEFFVYQLTETNQHWQIEAFRDPYNSCLSITILPTVLNALLGIKDEFVFKTIYQLVFSLVPAVIFLIASKYVSPRRAYLASMFFVFQPWFIQPAPALARQEIALLFFALLIWVTFHNGFNRWQRNGLQILFGTAMAVSHYSTTYVALLIFTLAFLASFILRSTSRWRTSTFRAGYISGGVLVVLYLLTFYWTSILTETSGNIIFVAETTSQNIKDAILSDLRSEDVTQALFMNEGIVLEDIQHYISIQNVKYAGYADLYPPDSYRNFAPKVVTSAALPGAIAQPELRSGIALVLFVVKQLTKVLLVLGALSLLRRFLRSRHADCEFAYVNLISVGILLLFMILPVLSLYYNLFRVYIQTLIVSSVSFVFGVDLTLPRLIKDNRRTLVTALVVIAFFFSVNGLDAFWTGGPAKMNLDNSGEEYDKFYVHEDEVAAAKWLSEHRDPAVPIYADLTAGLRLVSFGHGILDFETSVLPSTITRNSFVFADFANIHVGITQASVAGKQITYNYPLEFLQNNKDAIYDSGGTRIFK